MRSSCYSWVVTSPSSKPAPASERAEVAAREEEGLPEWTHEDCVQYEVARESITALMAYRSQWIFDEQQKPAPDAAAIHRWRAERAQYAAELRGLDVRDRALIARVCRDYGAEIRRLDAQATSS
jgi:hypothetical protein